MRFLSHPRVISLPLPHCENLFGASRCKAKDAAGLEVLVDLRCFSKDQMSDADRRPGV